MYIYRPPERDISVTYNICVSILKPSSKNNTKMRQI